MTRDATAAVITETKASAPKLLAFVELDFPSGFVRMNSTDRTLSFDPGGGAQDFLGAGRLGSISTIGETTRIQASGLRLSRSGIPGAVISAAFERAQGRPGKVWVGVLDSSYQLIVDPALVFSGLIDSTRIILGETGTVTINLENRLIAWERPKVRRFTNEDQQQRFAGDKFLEFVNQTVDKELLWGIGSLEQVPRGGGTSGPATVDLGGEAGVVPVGGGGEAGESTPVDRDRIR